MQLHCGQPTDPEPSEKRRKKCKTLTQWQQKTRVQIYTTECNNSRINQKLKALPRQHLVHLVYLVHHHKRHKAGSQRNHSLDTCTKARRIRCALYPMLNFRSSIPIRIKLAVLHFYENSILTCAGPDWSASISESRRKQIEAVQNIAFMTITGLPPYSASRNPLQLTSIGGSIHLHLQNNLGLTTQTIEWKRKRPVTVLE